MLDREITLERTNLDCFGKFFQEGTPGERMGILSPGCSS